MWSTLGLALLLAQPAPRPPADNWELLHRAGVRALQQKDYAAAERELLAALAVAQARGTADSRYAATLNSLGFTYNKQGKYAEAEKYYRRALEICEQAGRSGEMDLSATLHNLAANSGKQGRFEEAIGELKRALQIEERRGGPNNLRVALTTHQLGEMYLAARNYKDADQSLSRALLLRENGLGNHIETVRTLHALAQVKRAEGQPDSAEVLWARALTMQQVVHRAPDLQTAEIMENYADMLARHGETRDAELLRARARNLRATLPAK
jgi:tetratricopeptide (TPR) repeat protein